MIILFLNLAMFSVFAAGNNGDGNTISRSDVQGIITTIVSVSL